MTETLSISKYNDAKSALLLAFNIAAPTGIEQRAMVSIVHQMENDHQPYQAVLLTIANAYIDGITTGNWPQSI